MTLNFTVLTDELGLQREYREVKRKAAEGERIKNLRARTDYPRGTIAEVLRLDISGDAVTKDLVGATRYSDDESYVVLEPTDIIRIGDVRYRLVNRPAAVGERVVITKVDADYWAFSLGNVGIMKDGGWIDFNGQGNVGYDAEDGVWRTGIVNGNSQYKVLEPVDSASTTLLSTKPATEQVAENIASLAARFQTLEETVRNQADKLRVARLDIALINEGFADELAALKERIEALELASKPKHVGIGGLTGSIEALAKDLCKFGNTEKTPQQLRDEIVEHAKTDVKALLSGKLYNVPICHSPGSKAIYDPDGYDSVEFVINRDKRTVVALISSSFLGKTIWARGIAKSAPNNVFNAHIGMAIALRRVLGLQVPAEYLSVPNPTEVRVGDIVAFDNRGGERLVMPVTEVEGKKLRGTVSGISGFVYLDAAERHGAPCTNPKVIDDSRMSEVEDSAGSRKEVAA
ncbi:hypothetical protein [Paenibacillus tuaregi]|uniref:hypothetical protein n=1 Tax=Paenibacillus tuaregi TaxID=1816681 RepID=UPI0008390C72|nr:hypothetical protein [Paenibacillus tuaregi]